LIIFRPSSFAVPSLDLLDPRLVKGGESFSCAGILFLSFRGYGWSFYFYRKRCELALFSSVDDFPRTGRGDFFHSAFLFFIGIEAPFPQIHKTPGSTRPSPPSANMRRSFSCHLFLSTKDRRLSCLCNMHRPAFSAHYQQSSSAPFFEEMLKSSSFGVSRTVSTSLPFPETRIPPRIIFVRRYFPPKFFFSIQKFRNPPLSLCFLDHVAMFVFRYHRDLTLSR